MKFLFACVLIAAMSEMATAQTTIPAKCQNLHVTDYARETDRFGHETLYAVIKNDDPYNVTFATFYFDLLIGDNFKIGQGTSSTQRLIRGDIEKRPIVYSADRDIKDISFSVRLVSITCLSAPRE